MTAEPPEHSDKKTPESAEWGLSAKKEPMARETKVGLALIVVLVCAFSVVLYKRMQDGRADSDEVGDVASASGSDGSRSHKKKRTGNGDGSITHPDGVATSSDNPYSTGVPPGQREPRRLDDPPKKKKPWAGSSSAFGRRENERQQVDATKNQNSANPFGAGGTDPSLPHKDDHVTDSHPEKNNPFSAGTGGFGDGSRTAAQNTAFQNSGKRNDQQFGGAGAASPFGNPTSTKTAGTQLDGSATSTDDTPRPANDTGAVRLFPAKPNAVATHRRAEYVDPNLKDGRTVLKDGEATSIDTPKEKVFGLEPEKVSKQMQPLDDDSNRRDFKDGRRLAGDARKIDDGDRRFASKHPDGEHNSKELGSGRFEAQTGTVARTTSDTTVWPKRGENGVPPAGDLNQPLGKDERNAFTKQERRKAEGDHGISYGTRREETAGSKFGQPEQRGSVGRLDNSTEWPTRSQTANAPDGGATTYDERPATGNPNERHAHYTVRPGDNYWTISRRTYGTARYFTALAKFNQRRIPDPKKMRPGMHVLTPTLAVLRSSHPELFPRRAAMATGIGAKTGVMQTGFFRDESGRPLYRVADGDTLSDIAQKHLGRASRWVQVYEMNKNRLRNSKNLTIGTELRLPADASRIRVVRGAREFR